MMIPLRSLLPLAMVALTSCVHEDAEVKLDLAAPAAPAALTSRVHEDAEVKLGLAAPAAPFRAEPAASTAAAFKPEIQGRGVVCGNKRLDFGDDGHARLFADGRLLADMYFYFRLRRLGTNTQEWFWAGDGNYFDKGKSTFKQEGGKFTYQGVIRVGGQEGRFRQTAELLADGRVSFETRWSAPELPDVELGSSDFFISMPLAMTQGGEIAAAGRTYRIPDKPQYGFFELRPPRDLEFFPDAPAISFSVTPGVCASAVGWAQEKTTTVRLAENRESKRLTFALDIRKGVRAAADTNTCAGIDFMAIEKLGMPDYRASKNLFSNPSFEQGFLHYLHQGSYMGRASGRDSWETRVYSIDPATAKFGNNSLSIKTVGDKFPAGSMVGAGHLTSWGVPVEAGDYTFSFHAKCDQPGKQRLRLWAPHNDWTGKLCYTMENASIDISPTADWRRYQFTFTAPKSMMFCVNATAGHSTAEGHVWLDGLQLEKGRQATAFETRPVEGQLLTSDPDNFLALAAPINARLRITAKPDAAGKAKVSVKDFFGDTLYSGDFDFRCDGKAVAEIKLPLDGKLAPGVFVLKADYALDDGAKCHEFLRFSIMAFLENKHRLKDVFSDDYGVSSCRPDFLRLLERWRKIGVGSKTHLFFWDKDTWGNLPPIWRRALRHVHVVGHPPLHEGGLRPARLRAERPGPWGIWA